jgi:prepilin-type N-terminal cleavage/methylation domain-containing protein
MKNKLNKSNEQGFTIIEVLIVLAIAALILLIVFLAIPALQRSQRNNGRTSEATRFSTDLTNFVGSNNGNLPGLECSTPNDLCASTDATSLQSNFGTWHSLALTTTPAVGGTSLYLSTTTSSGGGLLYGMTQTVTAATKTLASSYSTAAQQFDGATVGTLLPNNTITVFNPTYSTSLPNLYIAGNQTDALAVFDGYKCGNGGKTTMTLTVGTSTNIALVYTAENGANKYWNYICVQSQ